MSAAAILAAVVAALQALARALGLAADRRLREAGAAERAAADLEAGNASKPRRWRRAMLTIACLPPLASGCAKRAAPIATDPLCRVIRLSDLSLSHRDTAATRDGVGRVRYQIEEACGRGPSGGG